MNPRYEDCSAKDIVADGACPKCGMTDIMVTGTLTQNPFIVQDIFCQFCGAEYTAVYELAKVVVHE